MDASLAQAITEYYKMKQRYDDRLNRQKQRIIRNPSLDARAKRQKFKQIRPKCVKCGKFGGTIFKNEDGVLSAICGSQEPCQLNIQINRGRYHNIRYEEEIVTKEQDRFRTDIIETKLDLLFNYTDEQTALKRFNTLRGELNAFSNYLIEIRKDLISIVDNKEDKEALARAEVALEIQKRQLEDLSKDVQKLGNERSQSGIIKDMVEKYVSQIRPLADQIRGLKYKYSAIVHPTEPPFPLGDGILLIEEPYTFNQLIVSAGTDDGAGRIISNIK